jgi:3-hydroxyisobutyrate dehydrogenase-like beta-hydroxyacid dehydrogenase
VDDLTELLGQANVVVSICPAAAAEQVAELVAKRGYRGVYADANAISPHRMRHIHDLLVATGTSVIDAVISGPPPRNETQPRIYLAGPASATAEARDLFVSSELDTTVLGRTIGAASALKMATASYLRTNRLLTAIAHALADEHGVTDALIREAEQFGATTLADRAYLSSVAARAWRWEAEMVEISQTLAESDLPTALAEASAQLFHLLAPEKDHWSITPESMLAHLKLPREDGI